MPHSFRIAFLFYTNKAYSIYSTMKHSAIFYYILRFKFAHCPDHVLLTQLQIFIPACNKWYTWVFGYDHKGFFFASGQG